MLHFSRWKTIAILTACAIGLLGSIPNFFEKQRVLQWPFPFNKSVNLGLDLQGGAHFLLAMDVGVLRTEWLRNIADEARGKMRAAQVASNTGLQAAQNRVTVTIANEPDVEKALRELRTIPQQLESAALGGTVTTNISVERLEGNVIALVPTEPGIRERETRGIAASIETLRRRLDPEGTREMTIVRQGRDRILVQIPGIEDPKLVEEYKLRIKETAKMTFHLVHPSMTVEDAKASRPPAEYSIFPGLAGEQEELLQTRPVLGGDQLVDAQPGFDQRTNEPLVSFRFNQAGARTFGRISTENVGRRFAILLDNKVISAPVIREPILGGTGQISGSFTVESANRLAVLLRSGALPAPLTIVEERTVGPSLGADSIRAGQIATIIGAVLVVAFMIFAYGLFGIFSIIAVAINIAMVLAIMGWIGSSLTLPGIAGILLTIGMAVDANVLIYERIREELRNKSTPINAIEKGFDRAFSTIVDANLTTLIAGLVMFWLGSGPIKGFAITLSLGILTTIFTAFTVTRLLVSWWVAAQKTKRIEAPI